MPLYTVRLESQTDSQWRERNITASDEKHAAKLAEAREGNRASYSLLDRQPVPQIAHRMHDEGVDATVNLDAFAGSGLGGHDLLEYAQRDHAVDGDGKTYGPNKLVKAHLHAHYQAEPYRVVSVERNEPNTQQIVQALAQLHGNPAGWDRLIDRLKDEGIPLAVVTGSLYGLTAQKMIDGSTPIVWTTATIKTALTTATYTPNQDTHHFFSDITNEVTGTGYTAGGTTLTTTGGTSYDTATDQIRLDATDASWTTSTLTARDAVVWCDTAGASTTDPVIGWVNFGADVSTTAGTFAITWDTTGLVVYDVT
jgi:hypothetical protein